MMVSVRVLDAEIWIKTPTTQLYNHISRYLHHHKIQRPQQSPDIEFNIQSDDFDWRFLFRDAPAGFREREPIFFRTPGQEWRPWRDNAPPLIPYSVAPLLDRFSAFHGACLAIENTNGLIVLGDRGAGKTTTAINLCKAYQYAFAADENVVVDNYSLIVRSLLRPPHQRDPSDPQIGKKRWMDLVENTWLRPIDMVQPTSLVVLINQAGRDRIEISRAPDSRLLVKHLGFHAFGWSSRVALSKVVVQLAQRCRSMLVYHGGFGHLDEVATAIHSFHQNER